jgi:uncharacterized protein YyaL (SSP411 family)
MSDPTARNRLDEEASPYLRQHADNPVHWQPWDDAALTAARERDVPIFLSIGYAACHWCHVMEDESFEDEAVAELLNEAFVPVKVDREERPDLDRIYQTVCRKVTGGGGWPLSVWLTPDGDPFYVGTYFPRDSRHDRPGFLDLCRNIAGSWNDPDERSEMESRAEQWAEVARDELESVPDDVDRIDDGDGDLDDALDDAVTTAIRSADRKYGGFGSGGPKFPHPGRVDLLLRAFAQTGRDQPMQVAVETLDAMADGGLYDHVGGGFHRYCTDREWVVPHFEKMLYDNAELPRVYLDAHRLTGRPRYALVAQETLAFVDRELSHPEGGFYATLDADSGEGEGAFYVWDESSLESALANELTTAAADDGVTDAADDGVTDAADDGVTDAADDGVADPVDEETVIGLVTDRYGIDVPNFEGARVLTIEASVDDLADEYDLSTDRVRETLSVARTAMYRDREDRQRPPRDEKVIAGWNGLAISAYATAARTLGSETADRGVEALAFVRDRLWDGDRLARRWADVPDESGKIGDGGGDGEGGDTSVGGVKGTGYLEDYAYLGRGAFDLYQATGGVDHLAFALDLARVIVDAFYDPEAGTIYATPDDGEELIARPQEPTDQSTPSSLGVATSLLLDLHQFAPDEGFEAAAADALAVQRDRIRGRPLEHVSLALAAAKYARGPLEVTVAAAEMPDSWQEVLAGQYLPDAVVARRPPTEAELDDWLDRLDLDEAPPIWADREARDGEPTAYVCRDFACSPPKGDLRAALDWADGGDAANRNDSSNAE